jgi:hypothetical protein
MGPIKARRKVEQASCRLARVPRLCKLASYVRRPFPEYICPRFRAQVSAAAAPYYRTALDRPVAMHFRGILLLAASAAVASQSLVDLITMEGLQSGLQRLQEFADSGDGTRAFGSQGSKATVDYLHQELMGSGFFDVEQQAFTETFASGNATLTVNDQGYTNVSRDGNPRTVADSWSA